MNSNHRVLSWLYSKIFKNKVNKINFDTLTINAQIIRNYKNLSKSFRINKQNLFNIDLHIRVEKINENRNLIIFQEQK